MALWLVRIGKHGEHEQKFLQNSKAYLTWGKLNYDLGKLADKNALRDLMRRIYPDITEKAIINWSGQVWPFAAEMKVGDWLIIPSKKQPAIHIAEVTGPYTYDGTAPDPYFHTRNIKWIANDIPRSNFDQDLLNSFGAIMTICQIERHDAENRVRAM